MDRNTSTTLDQLLLGDRFYKLGDRTKTAKAVQDIKYKTSTVEKVIICPSRQYGAKPMNLDIIKDPKQYQVIFLRHNEEL